MSWIPATIVIVIAGLACAFVLCEWIVARRRGSDDEDASTLL